MGKRKGHEKAKKNIDYIEIGKSLRQYNTIDENDLSENGPYGKTAISLGWSNSRKNRKYLKLIWVLNRGNVRNIQERPADFPIAEKERNLSPNRKSKSVVQSDEECDDDKRSTTLPEITKSTRKQRKKKSPYTPDDTRKKEKHSVCQRNNLDVDEEKINVRNILGKIKSDSPITEKKRKLSLDRKSKPVVISDEECDDDKRSTTLPEITKSTRKQRKKKSPYTPDVERKKEEHCICQKNYLDVDEGRMIQCQNCQKWYHCSCLLLPVLGGDITGKQIQFRCGRLVCNGGVFVYKVRGKEIFPEGCDQNETIFHKILKSESQIREMEKESMEFEPKVNNMTGPSDSYDFRKTSEELTVFLLNLDKISTFGLGFLREKRKIVVNKIHSYIQQLERKGKQNDEISKTKNITMSKQSQTTTKSNQPPLRKVSKPMSIDLSSSDDEMRLPDIPCPQNNATGETCNIPPPASKCPSVTKPNVTRPNATEATCNDENVDTEMNHSNVSRSSAFKTNVDDILSDSSGTKHTESDENNCNAENLSCNLNFDDLSDILHLKIPKYFSAELPAQSSFKLSEKEISHLNKSKNGRYYKKGHWQHIFCNGIAQSNKHCVFMFDMHQISSAQCRKKKRNSPLFKCKGHCKFKDCSVKVYLEMFDPSRVNVFYSGRVKHKVTHQHARPIRHTQREALKESFRDGAKPLKHFLNAFEKKDNEDIVSGNCNNIGKDTHVFRQISSESRQIGRKDDDLIQSLMKGMKVDKENGFGFIQKISASPCTIHYWSEEGLRLYHALANKDILYWDATGSVVRKDEENKKFLYYELALRHPVKGKMGIPVSAMLTNDQSLPSIQNWIARFRHDEKKIFGHNNTCQPKVILSDESWVFIIAALKEFNTETLKDSLQRSWNIALGKEQKVRKDKTIVHLCKSHFMQKVKRFCTHHYKRNLKFGLYIISLLLNSKDLKEASEIFHDISVSLLSPNITKRNKQYFDRLLQKINSFDTSVSSSVDINETEKQYKEAKPGFYTEEDFISLAGFSPFKQWALEISENAKVDCCASDEKDIKNPYYSEVFYQQIVNRYMPIFPLWGSITLPADTDSKKGSIFNNGNACMTQGIIENRFRILKQISLGDRKNRRIDDFSEELKRHTLTIQRLVVKDTLKAPSQVKRKRSQTTLKESWNKKQKPLDIQDSGVFQKPPDKHIVIPNKSCRHPEEKFIADVCPMYNLGSTCWFNSVIQALSGCNLLEALQTCQNTVDVEQDSFNKMKTSVLCLLLFIANNRHCKSSVPRQMLRNTLSDISQYDGELGSQVGQQHDANEFYVKVISPLVEDIGEVLQIDQTFTCIDCSYSNTIVETHVNSLSLPISESDREISIRTLLQGYFEHEIREKCQKCGGLLHLQQKLAKIPSTIVLTLNRFQFNPVTSSTAKIDKNIKIDREIDFADIVQGISHSKYSLKSIVCHHGRTVNSGHYTTNLVRNESLINVSDSNIGIGSEREISKNSYVLFYDRQVSLDPVIKPLLKCLGSTSAITVSSSFQNQLASADTYIPNILKNGDVDKAATLLERSLVNSSANNCVDVLHSIFQQVFGSVKDAHLQNKANNVLFYKIQVGCCKRCGNEIIKTQQEFCILQSASLSTSDISDCFTGSVENCEVCQSLSLNLENYYCCLPKSIIVCPLQRNSSKPAVELDLDMSLKTAFSILNKEYVLSSLLVRNEEKFEVLTNIGNMKNFEAVNVVAAFYNMKQKATSVTIMPNIMLRAKDFLRMRIPDKTFQKQCGLKMEENFQRKYPVSLDMAASVAKDSYWMTSDDINCYMEVLCLRTTEDVHFVDAGWFSHKVLKDGQINSTIFTLENRNYSWFTKSKVIIPVNVQNVHWVLIVLDMQERILYFCDPRGDSPNLMLLQTARYLSFEYMIKFGQKLDLSGWN